MFPDDANLSPSAKDLIQKMICDSSARVSFAQLKVHPFFRGIDWNNLRSTRACIPITVSCQCAGVRVPFHPVHRLTLPCAQLKSETDTSHFDKFPESAPPAVVQGPDASKVRFVVILALWSALWLVVKFSALFLAGLTCRSQGAFIGYTYKRPEGRAQASSAFADIPDDIGEDDEDSD